MSDLDEAAGGIPPDAEVSEKLAKYDETHAALALKEAADAAAQHDREAAPDPTLADQLARQRVAGWLAILERLNRDLDPGFDPEKPPMRRVSPPPTAGGTQYPPGVRPDDIDEPDTRKAYIAAIQENAEKMAAWGRNSQLYDAHQVVIERAPPSIADAHQTLGLPAEDIKTMISDAPISSADKESLLADLQ